VLAILGSVATLFMSAAMAWAMFHAKVPQEAGMPTERARWGIAASYGALLSIGAWWLALFNRGATKQYFAERGPARESARPLSIGIIGWYLLIGGAGTALAAILRAPAMLFGLVVTGWSAVAMCTALIAIDIYLGAGLLRLRERARLWSIMYFSAVAANSVVSVALPGLADRMQQMLRAMPGFFPAGAGVPQLSGMWMFALIGAGACALPVWFLVRRSAAFRPA
jgi:hypothetical protein